MQIGNCTLVNRRIDRALRALQLMTGIEPVVQEAAPLAGDPYTSTELPGWLARPGQVVTQIVPRTRESTAAQYPRCVRQPAGTPPSLLLPRGAWPQCGLDTPVVFVPQVFYGGATTAMEGRIDPTAARGWALAFWLPDRELPTGHVTQGTLTVRGLVTAASERASPSTGLFGNAMGSEVVDGRRVLRPQFQVSNVEAMDALELVCMALEDDVGGCPPELEALPTIQSMEDLDRLESHVRCVADRFERLAERLVFLDMPPLVADDVASARITGTYPSYSGEYGEQVAHLRAQMESVVSATRQFASVVRDVGGDLQLARSSERTATLEENLRSLELISQMSSHLSRCLAAASPQVGSGVSWNTGSVFVCADAVLQMVVTAEMDRLRGVLMDEELRQARTQMSLQFAARMDQMAEATRLLSEGFAGINATFSRMDVLRNEARRELAHSMFLDRDDVGREWTLGRGMRGRHNRTRAQYEEAHRAAVQLAWLARRAIEQRIGFELGEMHRDMTLVEAPSEWADSVCTTTGVDFWDVWSDEPDRLPRGVQTVADYVARLRLFLDSYMLDYPFENSNDVVVLSLRDDFVRSVDTDCSVEGWNLLASSEDAGQDSALAVWFSACDPAFERCPSVTGTGESVFVQRDPADDATGTARRYTRALGGGRELRFTMRCPEPTSRAPNCGGGGGIGGGWAQLAELVESTHYVMSWYERVAPPGACAAPDLVGGPRMSWDISAVDPAAPSLTVLGTGYMDPAPEAWMNPCEWRRAAMHFVVGAAGERGTPLSYQATAHILDWTRAYVSSTDGESTYAVGIAGPSIERVPDVTPDSPADRFFSLQPYFPTDANRAWPVGRCEERDASDIQRRFRYTCEHGLCPDGIGTSCSDGPFDPDLRICFWETEFAINLDDIERGTTIPNGGFAVGNFNYRIDSLAVNLVGTAVRDCSRVSIGAEGCYSSGFVPYSFHHTGGWTIRNHDGELFDMAIFPGAIVSGNALASERYLTNPLSGADRSLLTDAWAGELRGRPINGAFVLRIMDVPGLDFSRIEDVQLAISYRYWTRQE